MNADSNNSQLEAGVTAAKVKKEPPSTPTLPASCQIQQQQPVRLHQRSASAQPPPQVSSHANGHSRDLLQEVFKGSKFNNLGHLTPAAKHEAIRLMIEDSISEESRYRAQEIFSQIEQMKVEEKLLLYLKLSVSLTNPNGTVDPLRQPLNPLGNRYEIHQTIMWIKTHLEEDPDVSLPKQDVYDEYNIFCAKNSMKPLSTADFGKVMKQVYPRVRPRRLGTRGNSRYCYSGMRKRIKLDPPTLPSTSDSDAVEDFEHNEEMLGAASTLIREWSESLLGVKFPTLCSLGKYLVNNLCVDNRSLAAVCMLSASGEDLPVTSKVTSPATPVSGKIGKLREAQLQLQRKLQQREQTRDQQRDQRVGSALPIDNKDNKAVDQTSESVVGGGGGGGGTAAKKGKRGKATNSNHLVEGTNNSSKNNISASSGSLCVATAAATRQRKVFGKSNNQQSCGDGDGGNNGASAPNQQSNCDNLVVQSSAPPRLVRCSSAQSPREIKPRGSRKRAGSSASAMTTTTAAATTTAATIVTTNSSNSNSSSCSDGSNSGSSPEKQPKLQQQQQLHSTKIMPVILDDSSCSSPKAAKSNKTSAAATLVNQPFQSCDNKDSFTRLCSNGYSKSNGHATSLAGNNGRSSCSSNDNNNANANSNDNDKPASLLSFKNKLGGGSCLDNDTLNDYLNNGNNSQEQEEELLQYFQQQHQQPSNSSTSSSDSMELSNVASETANSGTITSRQDQVSQLRIILQDSVLGAGVGKPRALQSAPVDKQRAIQLKHREGLILPTLLASGGTTSTRRRVSFETSSSAVAESFSQDSGHGTVSTAGSSCSTSNNNSATTVPQSPNTRRMVFNFTPISPGPHSPINNGGRASKSSSANASPFVSPRNTPVPRSRSNLQGGNCNPRSRNPPKTLSRSISCNVPCSGLLRNSENFIVPISASDGRTQMHSPVLAPTACVSNKASQATPLPCCSSLLGDLGPLDQQLISYPSQENLQEIKNVYSQQQPQPQPTDQEISDLLQNRSDSKRSQNQQHQQYACRDVFYRSQSVPLHRMVDPTLLSPISHHHRNYQHQQMTPTFNHHGCSSFNASTNSSIAPTPVPSEFNDFLLDVDPLVSTSVQSDQATSDFMTMEDEDEKEMQISDNLNNIFEMLSETEPETMLSDDGTIGDKEQLMMESLGSGNLSDGILLGDNSALLGGDTCSWAMDNAKPMHSRSYPNTPLPLPQAGSSSSSSGCSSSVAVRYSTDDGNGSRSYPTTPLHNLHPHAHYQQEQKVQSGPANAYAESNEPMLSNASLTSNNNGNHHQQYRSTGVECNVADFLEHVPNEENEEDDLNSLGNFDGLPDVGTLSPLFNEVVDPNH